MVEGSTTIIYPRGSIARKQIVSFWVQAWQAIGGQAANTSAAMKYLLKQLEELAGNRDLQPVFIQWNATADPTAALNATELHDGWYVIDSFEPDYTKNVVSGLVKCRMTVSFVAAGPPARVALSYAGGALSSNYSGAATNLISLPIGSQYFESSAFSRTGAEGAFTSILAPVGNPEPVVLSTTLANIFKGGVKVFDTINTTSNPVPTTGGTFVHANWVEVKVTDHDFVGDCVLTNGLQLLLFGAGASPGITCYLWNTALAAANWQQYGTIYYTTSSTLRAYSLVRVGLEECAITALDQSAAPNAAKVQFRLQRGRYEVRIDFTPLTAANASALGLVLSTVATAKVAFNTAHVEDVALSEAAPAASTDYGYGAAVINSTTYPFLTGWLYQNQPASQPDAVSTSIGLGDSSGPAVNATRSYGIFAVPFGVNASYSPVNLQQEMETATLAGGFANVVDAGASGGNAAKLPSATAVGATAFQGIWTPPAGTYDVWARVRVTANASATAQLRLGLYDNTSGWVVGQYTDYAPSAFATTYVWYRVATNFTPTAAHAEALGAAGVTNAAATDFFVDEMVLAPRTLPVANTGPQDIWSQWAYDRSVRMVRP